MPNKWHVKGHDLRGANLDDATFWFGRSMYFAWAWLPIEGFEWRKKAPGQIMLLCSTSWTDRLSQRNLLLHVLLIFLQLHPHHRHRHSGVQSSQIDLEDSYQTEISKGLFCICSCWLRQELLISSYAARGRHSAAPTFCFFTPSSPTALPQLNPACTTHATYVTQQNSLNTTWFTKPMQLICYKGTIQLNA